MTDTDDILTLWGTALIMGWVSLVWWSCINAQESQYRGSIHWTDRCFETHALLLWYHYHDSKLNSIESSPLQTCGDNSYILYSNKARNTRSNVCLLSIFVDLHTDCVYCTGWVFIGMPDAAYTVVVCCCGGYTVVLRKRTSNQLLQCDFTLEIG